MKVQNTDWSVIRITILLYLIVLLLPFNYYLTKISFENTQNDASSMKKIVSISSSVHRFLNTSDQEQHSLINKIDADFEYLDTSFIHFTSNNEYIELFRAQESYYKLKTIYTKIKASNVSTNTTLVDNFYQEIDVFSTIAQNIINHKMSTNLNKLYLSLAFTMMLIITLIYFVRFYIKRQIKKHAIHDDLTNFYNNKYYENILEHEIAIAKRKERPLSLILLNITNYKELKQSLNSKAFEKELKEFSQIFSHNFRHSDTICRIEKSFLVVVAPDTSFDNAHTAIQRFHSELKEKEKNLNVGLCIKIGISTYDLDEPSLLLENAKLNMNQAKAQTIGGSK